MRDLIQLRAPSLIILMVEEELAGDVISLCRPCPSAASFCGTRRPTKCWLHEGREEVIQGEGENET